MKLKKITQKEFDELIVEEGIKQCPAFTDYSEISSFGERCRFGEGCRFGERCRFGEWCSFGEGCRFGERCSFGEWCSFGERCRFGERCSFGEWCSFGEGCSFEKDHKALKPYFIRINNIGSRGDGCIIFNFEDGIYIRSGCYFGTEKEFIARVKKTHSGNKHEKEYLMAVELAKITFYQ
jgi:hypothetical protein